jgi:hypothetical protein
MKFKPGDRIRNKWWDGLEATVVKASNLPDRVVVIFDIGGQEELCHVVADRYERIEDE